MLVLLLVIPDEHVSNCDQGQWHKDQDEWKEHHRVVNGMHCAILSDVECHGKLQQKMIFNETYACSTQK